MAQANTEYGTARRTWTPFVWIILASACAHLWCLGSQFYLDDMPQIRDSAAVRNGDVFGTPTLSWTLIVYFLQFKWFGMSAPAFHAVNWLLHTAVACVLFVLGRDLLDDRRRERVALFGAMLFAVHPLASEIPNYARCQDLAWVTLFSLIASWGVLRYLKSGARWGLLAFGLGLAGATFSKGPGFFHAAMMAGVVAAISLGRGHWAMLRRRAPLALGVFLALIAVLWVAGIVPRWFAYAHDTWTTPRFAGHGYTVARVFWQFAWRAVIPVKLSADHHIAETMIPPGTGWLAIPDKIALLAAASMLALTALSLFLMLKRSTRLFGACLFLFVATMLFRVMYVIPEFMPEYRIYPGMPWFCLGAAILLGALWRALPGAASPRVGAGLIILTFVVLSARRSFVWHDTETLCMDILNQYPAQGRAVWQLHNRDMEREDWQAIIDRQNTMWPEVFASFMENMRTLPPARDPNSGHFALADVASHGRHAIALAHVEGPPAGVVAIRRLELRMRQLGILEDDNRVIWGYFHHARAVVMEMAGNHVQALASMRFEGVQNITEQDIMRVEARIKAP